MKILSARQLVPGLLFLATAGSSFAASGQPLTFERAAYVTCREAHAMAPDVRRALASFLVENSARRHGVAVPEGEAGIHLGYLVRGGCTLSPDAHLYTVIDRAVAAELAASSRR